jgi:hypothetical protein
VRPAFLQQIACAHLCKRQAFMGMLMIIIKGTLFGFCLSFWAMLASMAVRTFY